MPQTEQVVPDRRQIVRYLLDLLPEDEAERIDLASIADDQIAAHVRVVESDLIDDYVLGSLTGETLQQFEARYLLSPRRRENVKMAARFLGAIEHIEVPGARVPGVWVPRSRLLLAVAAALVLAAGGAFMFRTTERPTPRLAAIRTLPIQPDGATIPKREELRQTPAPALAGTERRAAARRSAGPGGGARPELGVAALVLWPQTRSAGPMPTLLIPAGRLRAVLQLTLESAPFPQYRAGLKDPSNNEVVWRSGWLTPAKSGSLTSVRIAVPTAKMRPQHYSIELSGRSPDGTSGIVDSYTFRVGAR